MPDEHGHKLLYYTICHLRCTAPTAQAVSRLSLSCHGTERERERERERETDRQTDRQTGRQADRQTDRDRERQTDRQTDRSELVGTFLMRWTSFDAVKGLPAPEIKTS